MSEAANASTQVIVETGGEAARRLALATAVSHDLDYAGHLCRRLLDLSATPQADVDTVKAFWSTALLHYARAFSTGAAVGLAPENAFAPAAGEPLAAHRAYLEWAANETHGANDPFARVRVGIALSGTGERAVQGAGVLVMERGIVHARGVEQLAALADLARAEIARLGQAIENEVAEQARAEPIDELYARPRFEPGG